MEIKMYKSFIDIKMITKHNKIEKKMNIYIYKLILNNNKN